VDLNACATAAPATAAGAAASAGTSAAAAAAAAAAAIEDLIAHCTAGAAAAAAVIVDLIALCTAGAAQAMMKDRKLNPMQHSAGRLKMLLEAYTFWGEDDKHDFRAPVKPPKRIL
jgi:hypothetical protein